LFDNLEYEGAKKYFERAVELRPDLREAQDLLTRTNSLLGISHDRWKDKIRELEQRERVKIQAAMVALSQALRDARDLESRGSMTPAGVDLDKKEVLLSEQLDQLRRAKDRYRRVEETVNAMPYWFDLPTERQEVQAALARVDRKILEREDEIGYLRRKEAERIAIENREQDSMMFKAKIQKMLERVAAFFDRAEYQAAEKMANTILKLDPFNAEAESWIRRSRASYLQKYRGDTALRMTEALKTASGVIEEEHIPYAELLIYPADWDVIKRRQDRSAIGLTQKEEQWKADIQRKLQRKTSFDVKDKKLEEVVEQLGERSDGVAFIVDPTVLQGGAIPPIELRVDDMTLETALKWVLRAAGGNLNYSLRDHAVYISTQEKLVEDVEMRIYDVGDLILTIEDFPGPELMLRVAGDDGGGGAVDPFTPPPAAPVTPGNIADTIRNNIARETWDPAMGTSIDEMGGKLIVMQRPDIHKMIGKFLSDFRSTQKLMVNIESRFLTIREAYLEDIGVEYHGLDPGVLFGDFGDLSRVFNLNANRGPAQFDAPPPNVPLPGFTNGPDRYLGGSFSQVGSIVNHVISFLSNDQDTISGVDRTANRVQRGGISGQVTVLNNAQVQAFFKALTARENSTTLQAPRLTVFNTQRAHMLVARQRSYIADYQISGDSWDPVIRQFLEGVVLDVRPTVSSDRRYVTMELRPTMTELVNMAQRQIDAYTVNSGANANLILNLSFPIQFPELAIRRVRTTATVPDGGILLVGGMYRNVKFNSENGVPFLSDLPVIGRLFRWTVAEKARSNLSVLISPRIIVLDSEEE
jgi:hypothetical protein